MNIDNDDEKKNNFYDKLFDIIEKNKTKISDNDYKIAMEIFKDEYKNKTLKALKSLEKAVSGKYIADYFRKATHTISVSSNVHAVAFGDGIFPARSKSGLEKAFVGKGGKNKIDLNLEEHVFVEGEDELFFDHHGREIDNF